MSDQRPVLRNRVTLILYLKYQLLALSGVDNVPRPITIKKNSQVGHRLDRLLSLRRMSPSGEFSMPCAQGLCTEVSTTVLVPNWWGLPKWLSPPSYSDP